MKEVILACWYDETDKHIHTDAFDPQYTVSEILDKLIADYTIGKHKVNRRTGKWVSFSDSTSIIVDKIQVEE